MHVAALTDIRLHVADTGPRDGPPILFLNALGTDFRLWDKLLPLLPPGLRVIRFDTRGHGLSDCPRPPYGMGALIADAERLMDHLGVKGAVVVGLSLGGMVAQGLAVKRPDLVKALVLSNTAAKIGTPDLWAERIAAVTAGGVEALADATMIRWFTAAFRATPEVALWRNMLSRTPAAGWIGCAQAVSGTDFYTTTAALTLPVLGIAGSDDGSTPADLVRETTALVRRSRFELLRHAGHLPCVERPGDYAEVLTAFLDDLGHG